MIVAVIAVRVVQVSVDQVVDVIAVGNRFVAAAGSVLMLVLVLGGGVPCCAAVRVFVIDRDPVLIDVTLVRMVQMPVVEIVGVTVVADGEMTAVRPVFVVVAGVHGVIAFSHAGSFSSVRGQHASPAPALAQIAGHENHSQHGGA